MSTSKKIITLVSSSGEKFPVEEAVMVKHSQLIKQMIEVNCANDEIPLQEVTSAILDKVIKYCEKHNEAANDDCCESWDHDFITFECRMDGLRGLLRAADFMIIESLRDLVCQQLFDMMKDKTVEKISQGYGRSTGSVHSVLFEEMEEEERKQLWDQHYLWAIGDSPSTDKQSPWLIDRWWDNSRWLLAWVAGVGKAYGPKSHLEPWSFEHFQFSEFYHQGAGVDQRSGVDQRIEAFIAKFRHDLAFEVLIAAFKRNLAAKRLSY